MSIFQALDYAAARELLVTFYRKKRSVVVMDRDADVRVEVSFRAGGVMPGMALIRAVEKYKAAAK